MNGSICYDLSLQPLDEFGCPQHRIDSVLRNIGSRSMYLLVARNDVWILPNLMTNSGQDGRGAMANFRLERLQIRVSNVVDFDPNEGLDQKAFANIAELLSDFVLVPQYQGICWFAPKRGLAQANELLEKGGGPVYKRWQKRSTC